jgi:hypothetical protein
MNEMKKNLSVVALRGDEVRASAGVAGVSVMEGNLLKQRPSLRIWERGPSPAGDWNNKVDITEWMRN